MAFKTPDRVRDSTTTTGTGSITLVANPPTGYRTFGSTLAVNDTCPYLIVRGSQWEVGIGTLTATTTLARTTVLASSNADALVNFSAGTKIVLISYAGVRAVVKAVSAFTAGSLPFADSADKLDQNNAQLFWDSTNNRLGVGTASPSTKVDIRLSDAITNTTSNVFFISHNTTGVAAVGFGSVLRFLLDTSGTINVNAGDISVTWVVATDLSQKARIVISPYDTAKRDGLYVEADGARALVGFYVEGTQVRAGGVLFTATATGIANNTVAETSLLGTGVGTKTVPASGLFAGRTLRLKAMGFFGTALAPGTLTIKVKLGSTVILTTGAQTPAGSQTNMYWELEAIITCRTAGASGTVFGQSEWFHQEGVLTAPLSWAMTNTATTTVDTTVAQAMDLTAQWGTANISNDIECTNAVIEVLN